MGIKAEQSINTLLMVLIVVLLAVVVGQSVVMMKLHNREPARPAAPVQADADSAADAGDSFSWNPAFPTVPFHGSGTNAGAWDPFKEFRSMRQQMDQMFNDSLGRFKMSPGFESLWDGSAFSPNMDIEESEGAYVIRMDVPGADESKISVAINGRELSVSGTVGETVEKYGANPLRKERRSGRFSRTITLPGPVKAGEMEAEYEAGVLEITVPKSDQAEESRRIEVN